MKKLILFALVVLLIPLANAIDCTDTSYPFRKCAIIQNFTNVTAGSETCSIAIFKYIGTDWAPFVAMINITSGENYTIWREDFSGHGILKSNLIIGSSEWTHNLICENPEVMTFNQTGDKFIVPNNTLYCYYPNTLNVIPPSTGNELKICLTPNIAIEPSTFNFSLDLMTDIGIPWLEPEFNISANNYSDIPDTSLRFYNYGSENITLKLTVYSVLFLRKVPTERPFAAIYFDVKNETEVENVGMRFYYDEYEIISKGYDENNIRFYRYDEDRWTLLPTFINTVENYVETSITHFSLFGAFTSYPETSGPAGPQGPMGSAGSSGPTGPAGGAAVGIINITTVKEVPAKAVCGNEICEVGESCSICPDCHCPTGYECREGICMAMSVCGDGKCDLNETQDNCCQDCRCLFGYECRNNTCIALLPSLSPATGLATGITGLVTGIGKDPLATSIVVIVVIAIIFLVWKFRKGRKIKKEVNKEKNIEPEKTEDNKNKIDETDKENSEEIKENGDMDNSSNP